MCHIVNKLLASIVFVSFFSTLTVTLTINTCFSVSKLLSIDSGLILYSRSIVVYSHFVLKPKGFYED